MKSITQIAKECNIGYYQVTQIIKKENIIPSMKVGKRKFYDVYQEHLIIDLLAMTYLVGRPIYHIFESKMNKKKFKDTWASDKFNEFKCKTYN